MTRAVKYSRGQVAGAATRRRDRHPPRYGVLLSPFFPSLFPLGRSFWTIRRSIDVRKNEVRFLDESDRNVSLIKTWDDVTSLFTVFLSSAHTWRARFKAVREIFPGISDASIDKIRFSTELGSLWNAASSNVLRDSKKRGKKEKKLCINTADSRRREK